MHGKDSISKNTLGIVLQQVHIEISFDFEQVALCDIHDLVATVNAGNLSGTCRQVYRRLRGDVAFAIALRDDEDLLPIFLRWKPAGSLLSMTCSGEVC